MKSLLKHSKVHVHCYEHQYKNILQLHKLPKLISSESRISALKKCIKIKTFSLIFFQKLSETHLFFSGLMHKLCGAKLLLQNRFSLMVQVYIVKVYILEEFEQGYKGCWTVLVVQYLEKAVVEILKLILWQTGS